MVRRALSSCAPNTIGFLKGYLESRKKTATHTVQYRCACYCLTIQPRLTVWCEAPCILTAHGQIPSVAQDIGLSGWL
jgi:hypothetical protein